MGKYDKNFQEKELPLPDSKRLSDQNKEKDVVQDNEDEFDSSSFYSVLLQIMQDNQRTAKKPTKNAIVINNNKVELLINLRYN